MIEERRFTVNRFRYRVFGIPAEDDVVFSVYGDDGGGADFEMGDGRVSSGAFRGIERAKDLRAQGKPLVEATVEACSLRLRPIVMTGLAFVCGVIPMVIAHGAGAASQQALGTGVMGGMIAVVILALLMVPVFFVTVQRWLAGDREVSQNAEVHGPPAPVQTMH